MKKQLPFELVYQLSALIISIILVHLVYITVIRPNADAVLELRAAQTAAGELVENERSLYVVLRDYEQESCFILFFWAFAMMGYKARSTMRERTDRCGRWSKYFTGGRQDLYPTTAGPGARRPTSPAAPCADGSAESLRVN